MRTDLDHLPPAKQRGLERVVQILFEEFGDSTALATQDWKKKGRIQKIILYGSYARGGWVDDSDGSELHEPIPMTPEQALAMAGGYNSRGGSQGASSSWRRPELSSAAAGTRRLLAFKDKAAQHGVSPVNVVLVAHRPSGRIR